MSEYTCKFTLLLINSASDNMSIDASIVVMGVLGLLGKVKVLNTQMNVDTVRFFGREEITSVSVHLGNNEIQDVTFVCDDGWFLLTGLFWVPTVSSSADMLLPFSALNPQEYRDGSLIEDSKSGYVRIHLVLLFIHLDQSSSSISSTTCKPRTSIRGNLVLLDVHNVLDNWS